ncbi:MAG: DUF58 domain-containing protein [Pirellulales bacterium]|nr:DUF58 domain-containing protein [Pirellulales bacterium]
MSETTDSSQLSWLLDNELLASVERLRIVPVRRRTNRAQGEHLAGKGGSSIELSDYRDYVAGDDMRFVDWNIFARHHRPYMKLYEHEEDMHVVVLLDASTSMAFESKFDHARQLAAAFGVMALMGLERLSIYAVSSSKETPTFFKPCTGRANLLRMLNFVEGLEADGDTTIDQAIEMMLRRHRGRGVAIVLSDFLSAQTMDRSFNLLFSAGLEVAAVQILGATEFDPELTGDVRLVDSETGATLDVSAIGQLLGIYHEQRAGLAQHLEKGARRRSGRFLSVSTGTPVRQILLDDMRRRGWVR